MFVSSEEKEESQDQVCATERIHHLSRKGIMLLLFLRHYITANLSGLVMFFLFFFFFAPSLMTWRELTDTHLPKAARYNPAVCIVVEVINSWVLCVTGVNIWPAVETFHLQDDVFEDGEELQQPYGMVMFSSNTFSRLSLKAALIYQHVTDWRPTQGEHVASLFCRLLFKMVNTAREPSSLLLASTKMNLAPEWKTANL